MNWVELLTPSRNPLVWGGAYSALILFMGWRCRRPIANSPVSLLVAGLIGSGLLLSGLFFRLYDGAGHSLGQPIFEEMRVQTYLAHLLRGEGMLTGLSQSFYALLLGVCFQAFGVWTEVARHLSIVLGLLEMAGFGLLAGGFGGPIVGLIAVGLMSLNALAIQFSQLGIEIQLAQTLFVWTAVIFFRWKERLWSFPLLALFVLAGVHSYPGYTVNLGSLVFAVLLGCFCWGARPSIGAAIGELLRRRWSVAFFLLGMGTMAYLQVTRFPQTHYLRGGGGAITELHQWWEGFCIHIQDLVVRGDSYLVLFTQIPVWESWLWGFAIWGLVQVWRSSEPQRLWVLVPFMAISISSVAGSYPGVRRSLVVLYPLALFAARGIVDFISDEGNRMLRAGLLLPILIFTWEHHLKAFPAFRGLEPYSEYSFALEDRRLPTFLESGPVLVFADPRVINKAVGEYIESKSQLLIWRAAGAREITLFDGLQLQPDYFQGCIRAYYPVTLREDLLRQGIRLFGEPNPNGGAPPPLVLSFVTGQAELSCPINPSM